MLRFSYEPQEHGWAVASLTDDVSRIEMVPTLIFNDPLADLARACVALLDTVNSPHLTRLACSWPDEPGEWRWLLEKQGTTLRVRILRFDYGLAEPEDTGEVVFTTACSLLKLAIQVKTQLRDIFSAIGAEEYHRRTRHLFPETQLHQLKNLIHIEQVKQKQQRQT